LAAPGTKHKESLVLIVQQFIDRFGSFVMMPCAPQSVQQKRQKLSASGRRHDLFRKIVIAFKRTKGVAARNLNLIQIFSYLSRGIQRLRQRPLKGIVPEIRGEAAEGLLDHRGASQDLFPKRISRALRLRVEPGGGKPRDQIKRSRVQIHEVRIEAVD